jgi:hypothetical protein
VYSTGIKVYSDFELSCLLGVLGMQDLESSIAFFELEMILSTYGVKKRENELETNFDDSSPVNSKNADFTKMFKVQST